MQQREEAMGKIVASVAPGDVAEVLSLAEKTTPDEFRTSFRNALLQRWAESDVKSAMAYAEKVQGAQRRQEAIMAVLSKWVEQDSASAAAWAKQLPMPRLLMQPWET